VLNVKIVSACAAKTIRKKTATAVKNFRIELHVDAPH
jgi:hypothetical protein